MSDLSKRRVYVMDCGNIVKIGVSGNTEIRKNQLPFKVRQYYCTEPIKNAFEIEKMLHKQFRPLKAENVNGNEYFNVSFKCASDALRELTDDKYKKVLDEQRKNMALNRLFQVAPKLDCNQIFYILGVAEGMAIAKDSQKDKQLQEA